MWPPRVGVNGVDNQHLGDSLFINLKNTALSSCYQTAYAPPLSADCFKIILYLPPSEANLSNGFSPFATHISFYHAVQAGSDNLHSNGRWGV